MLPCQPTPVVVGCPGWAVVVLSCAVCYAVIQIIQQFVTVHSPIVKRAGMSIEITQNFVFWAHSGALGDRGVDRLLGDLGGMGGSVEFVL